jgi:hypothetical protein
MDCVAVAPRPLFQLKSLDFYLISIPKVLFEAIEYSFLEPLY